MKKVIQTILCLLLVIFTNAQETRLGYNLLGNVKFVEESEFEFVEKFGEIEVGEFLGRSCKHFNENGLLVKRYSIRGGRMSKDTSEIETFDYIYNQNQQLKEINQYQQYRYNGSKSLSYKTKFKYDEAGKLIQKMIYEGSGSFEKGFKYIYDNGERVEQQINSDGVVMTEDEIYATEIIEDDFVEMDSDGNVIENKITSKDQLDSVGNWIKRIDFRGKKQFKGYERRIIYF